MKKKSVSREVQKAAGALNEDQFFVELAAKGGYVDTDTAKTLYRGLVNLIVNELRTKGTVRLPQLADVYLSETKPMVIKNRFMAAPTLKEASHQVRMVPVRGLKQYFKTLELLDRDKLVDPRKNLKPGT